MKQIYKSTLIAKYKILQEFEVDVVKLRLLKSLFIKFLGEDLSIEWKIWNSTKLYVYCHKDMKEAIINALEFETAKKAFWQLRNLQHIRAEPKPKEENIVIKEEKDLFQIYFDENQRNNGVKNALGGKERHIKRNC